jgi:hypothetical protein
LIRTLKKNCMTINTNIDINSSNAILRFIKDDSKDGSRVEFVDFEVLLEILEVNIF